MKKENINILYRQITEIINRAKKAVSQNINITLVYANFEIGRMIVENEQKGKHRAGYAEETTVRLSKLLTEEFGKGY